MNNTEQWRARAHEWGQHIIENEKSFKPSSQFAFEAVEHVLGQEPIGSIAEFGCNVGRLIGPISAEHQDIRCYGFDINAPVLKMLNGLYLDVETTQYDLTKAVPILDSLFDVVLVSEVLQHISPDDIDAVRDRLWSMTGKWLILCEGRMRREVEDRELLNHGSDSWGGVWNYKHELRWPNAIMRRLENDTMVSYIIKKI